MMRLKENKKLLAFVSKILNYNDILRDKEKREPFLTSLTNTDTIFTEVDVIEIKEIATLILNNIDLFTLEDDDKEETINYCKKALTLLES